MKYKKINQLLHTLSYGDAISGEALALKRFFESRGIDSEIYAINIDPKYKGQAKFYQDLDSSVEGAVILHYSLGSPLNRLYKDLSKAKKYLIYHNLTPHHWFEGVNPRIVEDIKSGETELPELCALSDCLIADSEFNASELKKLGFESQVIELPLDPEKWNIQLNSGIDSLLKSQGRKNIVHVGRLAPNKCVEDIIKAFYFLHHKIDKNTHLWLVGIDIDTEIYSFALKRLVYELSLSDAVSFVGRFADSELKALYNNADVYVCASEHEGFCMPVIEAMYFGVPVVAYESSALPYTMKNAGILINSKSHPVFAEIIYKAATDHNLRERLITAGRRRAHELSYDNFIAQLNILFAEPEAVAA
jgi:glycosyltransferase involved in cell wall biosynthesis